MFEGTIVETLATALEPLKDTLIQIGGIGLGIYVLMLTLQVGWKLVRVFLGEVDYGNGGEQGYVDRQRGRR